MLSVGLTGGIASGKTTISDLFAELGTIIIDTDQISRQLLAYDQAGYRQVVAHFGKTILTQDLSIDRLALRRLVFSNAVDKLWLEAMLHPLIHQQTKELIEQYFTEAYVIVVVPLLFEAKFTQLVERILVVDCSAQTQLQRLIQRDGIDQALAQRMLEQQWTNEQRLAQADDIIDNDAGHDLPRQVLKLHHKYNELGKPVPVTGGSTA